MDAYDISRIPFGSQRQHYVSVRMQQGRVILDQDWNESESIDHEDDQRSRIDIIGPYGSPDKGFRIENLRIDDDLINFDIHYGTLYLSGLRLLMEPAEKNPAPVLESYRTQKDWLQQPQDLPAPELAAGEERYDLVYLKAWQQPVSAVEDAELFEVALGGPDTTTRIRNMRRVRIAAGIGQSECLPAWLAFRDRLEAEDRGLINEDHELIPDTRLFVDYIEIDDPDDLCAPDAVGGYLGAENQSIRVQLRGADELIWGFDNAAPLYRVETTGNQVHFLTEPKDQHHWPLAGQIVEILPWSAVLANGEKTAALMGHLSRVETSYDPDASTLTLTDALPAGFGEAWKSRPDSADLQNQDPPEYFYLRVWRGIPDDEPILVNFTTGNPVLLGNTGIRVTITGEDRNPGDHWIIAARPETPDEVLPWDLENVDGTPLHGIRRYFAPLAIIHWQVINGEVQGKIIRDCRKTFRPLTDLESCCTFHVGDGVHSHGDFNSIEEALQNLPEAGGHICVLAGEHRANVSIFNRHNICISGCGERSVVIPHPERLTEPIFGLAHVQNICIKNLNLAHPSGTAIHLLDLDEKLPVSTDIRITHNHILACENGIYLEVNDVARGKNNIYIGYNQIAMADKEDGDVAIFCLADEVLIERNKIVALPPPAPEDPDDPREEDEPPGGIFDPCDDGTTGFFNPNFPLTLYIQNVFKFIWTVDSLSATPAFQTLSGIQIGGGSEYVRLLENEIIGGAGNGITFGHIVTRTPEEEPQGDNGPVLTTNQLKSVNRQATTTGFLQVGGLAEALRGTLAESFNSFLYEIDVEGNRIQNMGLSGIGVIAFFDEAAEDHGLIVQVENLSIYRNHISQCARSIPEEIPVRAGYGGIALSSCERARIEENRIENNGLSFVDPICGVYILNGEDVDISRNRIVNNGPRLSLTGENFGLAAQARSGARGGIYIGLSFKRQFVEAIVDELLSDGVPAAKIHGNIVVQPLGQALYLIAFGPVSVVGNQFTSHEIDFGHSLSLVAGAVLILNLGVSKDLLRMAITPTLQRLPRLEVVREENPQAVAALQLLVLLLQYLPSGAVLFANNQTTLDLRNLEVDFSLCSQLIASLDDVSFTGNQAECTGLAFVTSNQESSQLTPIDLVLFNTVLAGVTVRTTDNRFQEGFTFVLYSLLSFGFMNTTLGNQSTNCLLDYGSRRRFDNNLEQFLNLRPCNDERSNLGQLLAMDQPYRTNYAVNARFAGN